MSKLFLSLTAMTAVAVCAARASATVHTFTFTARGSQEVPPSGSTGTAACTVTLDDVTNAVTASCTFSGLSSNATAAHIHGLAPPGMNAGVLIALTATAATSGTVSGNGTLSAANAAGMLAGNTYLNIHTSPFPGGEIRGQVVTAETIVSANPPRAADNPYVPGAPFRDVLQDTDTALNAQGIGVAGTPNEGVVTGYAAPQATFSGTPTPAPAPGNIGVGCTGGACPTVSAVSGSGPGPYTLTLTGGIPALHCTTFTFAGTAPGEKLQFQALPADTNINGSTTGQDVLTLVTAINNGSAALASNLARYDINRNGAVTGQDVLREVQLINGTSASQAFNGAAVAPCP